MVVFHVHHTHTILVQLYRDQPLGQYSYYMNSPPLPRLFIGRTLTATLTLADILLTTLQANSTLTIGDVLTEQFNS